MALLTKKDREILREAFNQWPQRLTAYGHLEKEPHFTQRIETLGQETLRRLESNDFDAKQLRDFLIQVGRWKMPRSLESHQRNVKMNSDKDIIQVFQSLVQMQLDDERIATCTKLAGFGRSEGQTRMASAILRFLWPAKYGVIDWRNWAVLSNCGHAFLDRPLLKQLSPSPNALRNVFYGVSEFVDYIGLVRTLCSELGLLRAADVDLALYSHSAGIWPFPRVDVPPDLAKRLNLVQESANHDLPRLKLHDIYETYWPLWEQFDQIPPVRQRDDKLNFLWSCLEITPDVTVWDPPTQMKLPYKKKHQRDLEQIERKVAHLPPEKACEELDHFMWQMRLKGEGLGVI